MSFIEISGLTKKYLSASDEVTALDGVDGAIDDGEFVTVMGPSGSGKSTFLSILGGLTHPSVGRVTVDEMDIYSLANEQIAAFRSEYLGFVFQDFNLVSYLTVIENVMIPLAVKIMKKEEKIKSALAVLERVGLSRKAQRLPCELSGGEQERVAIARAVINNPPVILADEPTGNLDTTTGKEIMELFRELNRQGHTIVMVTHNGENTRFSHRNIVIRDGRIIEN